MLDRHMDRYRGVVTSDKYPVYKRSGPGGRHQPCRAHELLQLRYAAQKKNAPLSAWVLYLQVLDVYHAAPGADRPGHHCARLRRESGPGMRRLLSRYRDAGGTPLEKHARRLATSLPHLFAFLEYPGVGPTSNAAERALRQVVVSRKISGQVKGGEAWTDRWSWFMTCILTWRLQGKSLADEVSKIA